jgi:DNA-binding transcriptional LysR family regulator
MKELARLGCGVALLPENLVKSETDEKILKRQFFGVKWLRKYGIFVEKSNDLKQVRGLIEEIVQIFRAK